MYSEYSVPQSVLQLLFMQQMDISFQSTHTSAVFLIIFKKPTLCGFQGHTTAQPDVTEHLALH